MLQQRLKLGISHASAGMRLLTSLLHTILRQLVDYYLNQNTENLEYECEFSDCFQYAYFIDILHNNVLAN